MATEKTLFQAGAQIDKLIIVYNAGEGWMSALIYAVHKLVRPQTYPCSLCSISYGALSMRKPWRRYLNDLPMEKRFYHRQNFERAYPVTRYPQLADVQLPVMLLERDGRLLPALRSEELDMIGSVEGLIAATDLALERLTEEEDIASRIRS